MICCHCLAEAVVFHFIDAGRFTPLCLACARAQGWPWLASEPKKKRKKP